MYAALATHAFSSNCQVLRVSCAQQDVKLDNAPRTQAPLQISSLADGVVSAQACRDDKDNRSCSTSKLHIQ